MKISQEFSLEDIKPLSDILAYHNEDVLLRFMKRFDLNMEESKDIFENTLKWLWLVAISKFKNKEESAELDLSSGLFINDDLLIIDEMWHTFILFTIDYRDFCLNHFGFFIHHGPTKKNELDEYGKRLIESPEQVRKEAALSLKWQYGFIHDYLGEETLLKWHNDYPEKYSKEIINKLQKPLF